MGVLLVKSMLPTSHDSKNPESMLSFQLCKWVCIHYVVPMGRPGSCPFNLIHLVGFLTHVESDLHPAPETNR